MKPFTFRLQSLLRHAKRQKDQSAALWAKARREVDATNQAIAAHEAELASVRDRHAPRDGKPIAVAHLQSVHSRLLWHRQKLIRGHAQLQADSSVLEGASEHLKRSRQECKKLETLREKRHDAWTARQLKFEQKELDAVASRLRQVAAET